MATPATSIQKQKWHSTYYKVIKQLVVTDLRFSSKEKAKEESSKVVGQLATISRDLAQVVIETNDSNNPIVTNLSLLNAHLNQLNNPRNPDALTAYNRNAEDVNAVAGEVNQLADKRHTLAKLVQSFTEKSNYSNIEIKKALENGDVTKAKSLLKELSNDMKTLKDDLVKLKIEETKLNNSLKKLNNEVTTSLRVHMGASAQIQTLGEGPATRDSRTLRS